ncbi:hypothetical protein DAEQUDRAFT_731361 [Daedalea quercina L-15889]|uniref:Rhodanese domain-containing protein n=1 Tax=Daedalea quercina L-15889 TaxID=1314783 RepID=A0A165MDD3_9APHY|nr:hypothetical protein DAEQUDRAFT_731361 [Daedalea quercina L-15889]
MSSFQDDNISYASSSSYGEVIARDGIATPLRTSTPPRGRRSASSVASVPVVEPRLTLEDVRLRTADSIAIRAVRNAEKVDGTTVGVLFTLSHTADEPFLGKIAQSIRRSLLGKSFLFAVGRPSSSPEDRSPMFICGSTDELVQRAGLLISCKFLGRLMRGSSAGDGLWTGEARNLGASSYDEAALWDSVRKAARNPVDSFVPPPGSRSVEQLVSHARARLERLTPQQAFAELHDTSRPWPVILVDIRPENQRAHEGGIFGSYVVERGLLEWRFDPRSPQRAPIANRYDLRIIVVDQEGGSSSLAATSLHDLGMLHATDIIGGFAAWREAGLPMKVSPAPPLSESASVGPSEEY